jgi:hypothetical protein
MEERRGVDGAFDVEADVERGSTQVAQSSVPAGGPDRADQQVLLHDQCAVPTRLDLRVAKVVAGLADLPS